MGAISSFTLCNLPISSPPSSTLSTNLYTIFESTSKYKTSPVFVGISIHDASSSANSRSTFISSFKSSSISFKSSSISFKSSFFDSNSILVISSSTSCFGLFFGFRDIFSFFSSTFCISQTIEHFFISL